MRQAGGLCFCHPLSPNSLSSLLPPFSHPHHLPLPLPLPLPLHRLPSSFKLNNYPSLRISPTLLHRLHQFTPSSVPCPPRLACSVSPGTSVDSFKPEATPPPPPPPHQHDHQHHHQHRHHNDQLDHLHDHHHQHHVDQHGEYHEEHHRHERKTRVPHGDLLQWMLSQGLPPCKIQVKEWSAPNGKDKPIHYVAASQDIQEGELVLSVPWSLVVTLERVLGNETIAELLTTNKLSELACLALYLMYEKKRGKESFWYPFIRELDRQRGRGQVAVESPLLWSSEELNEYFAGSPMKAIVLERLEGIKREYAELDTVWFMAGSLFKQYPFDIPTEAFPFEIFKQAFVAVQSCVVHLQGVSLARRFALIPLGPPLLGYKSNCKAMLKVVGDHVQLEVDRPYKAGEPIVVWCGPQPNSRLLLNYGFVDEDNPHDRLAVEASLSTSDPLYQAKRTIVQKHNKSTIQTFQFYKGKEKETLLDMLPYLRLAHLSDPQVLDSVFAAEGPVCPVSSCNERAVLEQLSEYFIKRLAAYPTSLAEDESLLKDIHINPKRRVATQLMHIEKQILVRTLEELQNYKDRLPNESVSPCWGPYIPNLK